MRPRQQYTTRKAPLRATSHYTVPNYYLTRRIERSTAAPFARAARTPWHGATAADHCAEQLGPWCTAQSSRLVMRSARRTPWSARRSRARDGRMQLDRLCRTTRARAVRRSMNSSCVGKPCVAFGPATAHRRPESRTHNARECEGARRLQAMKSKDRSACVVRAACSTARHGMHTFHLLGDHLAMPVAVRAQCTHHGGGLRGEQRLSQGEGNKARFGACARGHALAPTERHVTVHRNVKHASVSIARGKRASASGREL
jgi:hypothetical protein